MKFTKFCLVFLFLSACNSTAATPTAAFEAPTSAVTAIPQPVAQAIPTESPPPTPVPTETAVATRIIDVAKSSTEWDLSSLPQAEQTAIKDWLANPYTATAAEKQIVNDFLTKQWQLALKESGVANAETLQGYPLYEAIIAYGQAHGGEVGLIPNDLHQKVRTDINNMIVYGAAPGLDPYVHTSMYGFGSGLSNPNLEYLQTRASKISQIDFYGKTILREGSNYPITPDVGIEGDLALLFDLPGVDRSVAQGAIIKMIDPFGTMRYAEVQLQYTDGKTTDKDMCIMLQGNQYVGAICGADTNIPLTKITSFRTQAEHKAITEAMMLQLLTLTGGKIHLVVAHGDFPSRFDINDMWQNGLRVVTGFTMYSDIPIP